MRVRFSRLIVFSILLLATAAAADDQPHKCSNSAQECERQIRQMLSGRRYLGALVNESDLGLIVKSVKPESPADRGGLMPGDRLMSVNGHTTMQAKNVEFKKILGEAKETGRLWMVVARRGILKHVEIRMEPYAKEQVDRIVAQHLATEHAIAAAPGQ
jgi:predicted metalloprotease with PDZ domain